MQGKKGGWVLDGGGARRKGGGKVALTDRPYGDRLSPTGEVLLRSALTNAVGGDAGKVNSTKPFQGLPIFSHKLRPNLLKHPISCVNIGLFLLVKRYLFLFFLCNHPMTHRWMSARVKRGTNITGKADRSASVPSVKQKQKEIAVRSHLPGRGVENKRTDKTIKKNFKNRQKWKERKRVQAGCEEGY